MLVGYAVNPVGVPQWGILLLSMAVPFAVGMIVSKIRPDELATVVWLVGFIWVMIAGLWVLDMPTGPSHCFQCGATAHGVQSSQPEWADRRRWPIPGHVAGGSVGRLLDRRVAGDAEARVSGFLPGEPRMAARHRRKSASLATAELSRVFSLPHNSGRGHLRPAFPRQLRSGITASRCADTQPRHLRPAAAGDAGSRTPPLRPAA